MWLERHIRLLFLRIGALRLPISRVTRSRDGSDGLHGWIFSRPACRRSEL